MRGGFCVNYDKIVIGAGLYGLYAALFCAKKGESVLVLEHDGAPFQRATYINQARVHMGYHYPRSLSTAIKSAGYFERFNEDFGFCIHKEFDQIYATSAQMSWTNAGQFQKFCQNAGIPCEGVSPETYFEDGMCDGAFRTREYTYDAMLLKEYYEKEIAAFPNLALQCNARIKAIAQKGERYLVALQDGSVHAAPFVLNASYASANQILDMLGLEKFSIKYELCEIILCQVSERLKDIGITVMDGPFFSIMPFGRTGLHSLTSVTFTPHETSYGALPSFACQEQSGGYCSSTRLGNCNGCVAKPPSAWEYMSRLAGKYVKDSYTFSYHSSLYSIKPILTASEVDDSRPTIIRQFCQSPTFVSVLSGKINTVYDLDEILTKAT